MFTRSVHNHAKSGKRSVPDAHTATYSSLDLTWILMIHFLLALPLALVRPSRLISSPAVLDASRSMLRLAPLVLSITCRTLLHSLLPLSTLRRLLLWIYLLTCRHLLSQTLPTNQTLSNLCQRSTQTSRMSLTWLMILSHFLLTVLVLILRSEPNLGKLLLGVRCTLCPR